MKLKFTIIGAVILSSLSLSLSLYAANVQVKAENLPEECFLGFYRNEVPSAHDKKHLVHVKIKFYAAPDARIQHLDPFTKGKVPSGLYQVVAVVCGDEHFVCNYDHKRSTYDVIVRDEKSLRVETKRHHKPVYTECKVKKEK